MSLQPGGTSTVVKESSLGPFGLFPSSFKGKEVGADGAVPKHRSQPPPRCPLPAQAREPHCLESQEKEYGQE